MALYSREAWLGTGTLRPDIPAVAGEYATWVVHYTVGVAGIDDGGRVRLAYRIISDLGDPQFTDPAGENYVSAWASRPVNLRLTYEPNGGVRPWNSVVTVWVSGGALGEGDTLTLVLGDTVHGGPGMRCQTFPQSQFTFKLQASPFGSGAYDDVTDLSFPIIGGPATQFVVVGPSDIVAGEPTWLQVRALDPWGNPDASYRGTVSFSGDVPEGLEDYTFTREDAGVHRFEDVRFTSNGILRVGASDTVQGLTARSNPIRSQLYAPERRVYWGDLHGQTQETVGTGTIHEYFHYARNVAAVDAAAHSGNDFQITNEVYQELREEAERFHEPERFVTFHGYEWSGNTPAGGDHNVYYFDDGPIRRSSHALIDDTSDADTDCYPIDRLYAANQGRDDVLITPHIGGRMASLDYHDPELEPAIELGSQWGRFEWFAHDALERGMKVGFIGGSDDHSGRPGWSTATLQHHGVRGALTAYQATELTRAGIWEALRSRRVYGTSGERMLLDVSANGHPMGAEFTASEQPEIAVSATGTAPLDTIELHRGVETVYTHACLPEPGQNEPWRIRLAWRGARSKGRTRPLNWSGELHVWNGAITQAENYAIDNPLDGIRGWEADRLAWESWTCGDWDGLILDLDGDENTSVSVRTQTMSFRFTLADLAESWLQYGGPLLEQQLIVRRLSHRAGSAEASFTWRDPSPEAGVNPYWIWVTQSDGELAWSSPIYVHWNE